MGTIFSCLCGGETNASLAENPGVHSYLIEKQPHPTPRPSCAAASRDRDAIVADVLAILRTAEKKGVRLVRQLDDTVGTQGWTEWIAKGVLASLETVIKEGREKMGPAMAQAYDGACEAAKKVFQFAKDHPVATSVFLTIVAIGVLAILAPYILEALGFAELGPVEGKLPTRVVTYYA